MRRLALLAAIACPCACATPAPLAVTGELSKDSAGRGYVRDCMSGEVFALGVMATGPYYQFFQRAEKLAAQRGRATDAQVIVELEGEVSDGSPRVLSVRRELAMRLGTCDDPAPGE